MANCNVTEIPPGVAVRKRGRLFAGHGKCLRKSTNAREGKSWEARSSCTNHNRSTHGVQSRWRRQILRNEFTSNAGNPPSRLCRLFPLKRAERVLYVPQEVGLALNRAKLKFAVQFTLLSAVFVLNSHYTASAQARGKTDTRRPSASAAAAGGSRATVLPTQHTFYPANTKSIPAAMTVRKFDAKSLARTRSRAPGDQSVIRQTILLSKLDPSVQFSYTPAPCNNQHPYWTSDEKFIYFDSNRNSDTDPTTRADGLFNIYHMFADGSGLTQVRTSTTNEIEPCISVDGTTMTFVAGGSLTYATGLDNPTSSSFSLYTYSVAAGGTPVNLTSSNPSGFVFTDVRHPSFSPGADRIVFQGQLGKNKPYHIFIVDPNTDVITQITGPAPGTTATVESNDTSPAWSPDGHLVAFGTNASGFTSPAPMQATGINPATQTTPGDTNQYDIWVVQPNAFSPNAHRVTNSTSVTGGAKSSNKNPAWSSLRADPLQLIPNQINAGANNSSENLLAFASTRANADVNNPHQATAIKSTFDIYFLHTKVATDPALPGAFTVITPETSANAAIKLPTTSPGKTFDPTIPNDPSYADPTFNFDPNFTSNEDYPAWPQYISSYRIAFQSDRGNSLQLWASTLIDINAPSLLRYDLPSNEIVRVARDSAPNVSVRQVNAGEKVRFKVRAVDYESGIQSVFIQIKDPNSAPQSADGQEHKTYYVGPGVIDTNIAIINAPYELDSQAINPTTYLFRANGFQPAELQNLVGGIPRNWPGWNLYMPAIDDLVAYSGGVSPPDTAFWLQLWDDGPVNDPVSPGHEPPGEVKGDGVYTASWVTPASLPSDWYIDVILRDNALNPFEDPTNPNSQCNWKIYDNVWGFTTQPFVGNSGILYVNDYDCGQKFFQSNAGTFTNTGSRLGAATGSFNSQLPGSPGTFYTGVQTESWMTETPNFMAPNAAINGTTIDGVTNYLTSMGINAYKDVLTQEPGGANPIPVTARYDQWRVLSRGPVPDTVLNAYKGHLETQPADVIAGGTGPRQVFVAERCVFWHAPYAGDLFVGPGTIIDADTQVRLANFVQTGGRLMLNGTDVAWALTLGGGASNALLSTAFKVNYIGDFGGVIIKSNLADPPVVAPYKAPLGNGGRGTHPIIMETWYNAFHGYPSTSPPNDPPGLSTFYLQTPLTSPFTPLRFWGAPNTISGDELQFLGTATLDTSDIDASYTETSTANTVWVTNSAATPIVSKAVFISMPLEAINPEYFIVPTNLIVLKNRRAEIIHNIGDYLRTGRIVGVVRDLNGNVPIKGVFLRATSQHRLNSDGTPFVYATGFTLSDGSYSLDALDCTGGYNIDCFKAGFITSHGQAGNFHGGYQTKQDFFLAEARPGSISGTVTLAGTTTAAPGLIIVATDVLSGAAFTAKTDTTGAYTIQNVPASNYSVTIPKAPTGNLDTLGYGSCIPSSYGPSPAPKPQVVVANNANTGGIDFQVTQTPGSITGIVTSHTANGNAGNIIIGATVTATDVNGVAFTAVTDSTGHYTITNLVPGVFKVTAAASGYRPSQSVSVTVITNTPVEVDFVDNASFPNDPTKQLALVKASPGSISGLVSTSQGIPVPGATVTITDAGGNVLLTLTTTGVQGTGSGRFNYTTGLVVPAGAAVSVAASKTGYNAVTPPANPQSITVAEGATVTGVNFYLDPLHTFNPALSLVSAPYDYTSVAGGSVASLLGIPSGDVSSGAFAFITWNPTSGTYVNYPTSPADTFHLGDGYFMQDTDTAVTLSLSTPGTPATPNTVFRLHLKPGWNLIGDPFSFPINFLNLKVLAADGTEEDILTAQTGSNPTLGAALWGFDNNLYEVSYTLDPWKGYWLRVFDNRPSAQQGSTADIVLLVDPAAQQNRSASAPADSRFAITSGNNTGQGWKLGLTATAGSLNAAPATVGVMRGAINGYDRFKLEAPPAVGKSGVSVAIEHTDWNKQSGRYAVDLRSPGTSSNSWNFTVTSTVPKQTVVLGWPSIATVSSRQDVMLTDTDTNTTINLRTHPNYTMQAGTTGVTRHFTVTTSAAKRISLQIANINARLLGGGTGRAAVSATIGYTLTADATTQVSILKNGRVVRTIESGVSRAAGDTALVWDLKNNQGASVPADAYILEVRAQDAQGHLARQVTPLIIVR